MRYVLDSDHISLLLGGDAQVLAGVSQHINDLAITIISVQEIFNGWTGRLNRSSDETRMTVLYARLDAAVQFFHTVEVLSYTPTASATYQQLIQTHPPLAKRRLERDVRIASIARSVGATVVTRNRRDFELVPGLAIVDWSV
jgi:tRNA(fMet)-specific endonuclease VapC